MKPDVVVDDDGDVIELPEARQSRMLERERCDAEREARHVEAARKRAHRVLKKLNKCDVRELQDADVLREFVKLVQDADGTDYRAGHSLPRWGVEPKKNLIT